MTYAALAVCCTLLSYGAVNAAVSLGVALFWRFESRRISPPLRAPYTLLILRLLPTAASTLFVALFFLPGFLRLEPRDGVEAVGPLMLAIASVPGLLLVGAGWRGVRSLLATERLVRHWTSGAERLQLPETPAPTYCIDSDFPVISLAGVVRPRLFLSRQVVRSCTATEIQAALAHEAAHRASRDNLKGLLMRSCPDFLSWTSVAKSIESTWNEISEAVADESAAGSDPGARAELAAVLVKIARLAVGRCFPYEVPVSAFLRVGSIDARVRRLMGEPGGIPAPRHEGILRAGAAGGILLLLVGLASQPKVLLEVHRITEIVVQLLQ